MKTRRPFSCDIFLRCISIIGPVDRLLFYASNEPKSALARDLGDCRDNYEKLAKRVSCSYASNEPKFVVAACIAV